MISIIYEDSDLIAINKPSGITVNKSDTTHGEETVQDWAEQKLNIGENQFESSTDKQDGGDFYNRGGIVHRLDKETSGVMLIAKNPQAFMELQRQFKERIIKKTYLALAHGKVTPGEGIINVPVGRLPWNRKQFGIVAGGREAVTKYKVLKHLIFGSNKEDLTLIELYPLTGRTHQIRVHLKYIGYPIFGDFLYAGRKIQREDRKVLSRVFLHAARISFLHPTTGKEMELESKLPQELQNILK